MATPWADGPFKLIVSPRKRDLDAKKTLSKEEKGTSDFANEMVMVHNAFIRGLNAIYLQAPNIKLDKDSADFCEFIYAWSLTIHMHHDNEEAVAFPVLEEYVGVKGLLDGNVEQHHAFTPGLKALDEYVARVREKKEKYDGAKVKELLDSFAPVLVQHLTDEIDTLESLVQYDDKIDWKTFTKKFQDQALGTADLNHEIPFVLTNVDTTYEAPIHNAFWPPFPWYAALLFQWVYIPRRRDAWRFSSCNAKGRPKALPFA